MDAGGRVQQLSPVGERAEQDDEPDADGQRRREGDPAVPARLAVSARGRQ
jgi:hypothetical protein